MSDEIQIPEHCIEAAARAICWANVAASPLRDFMWDSAPPEEQEQHRQEAEAVLRASLRQVGWGESYGEWKEDEHYGPWLLSSSRTSTNRWPVFSWIEP